MTDEQDPRAFGAGMYSAIAGMLIIVLVLLLALLNGVAGIPYPTLAIYGGAAAVLIAASVAIGNLLNRFAERAFRRTQDQLFAVEAQTRSSIVVESGGTLHISDSLNANVTADIGQIEQTSIEERRILISMYSRRVGQAQAWFRASIIFGTVGAAVLLAGIGLAVSHANSSGQRYTSIVASSASVVTNVLAFLFFRQSNLAQKIMASQVEQIRESLQTQRDAIDYQARLRIALELVEKIEDPASRDVQRADVAAVLAGSQAKRKAVKQPQPPKKPRNPVEPTR